MTSPLLVPAVVTVFLMAGCDRQPPLANALGSPEAVARAVLDALQHQDRAALDGLVLHEREFHDHVWPALPAARPARNLPFSYVWGDLQQKSRLSLARTLERHAGRRYELSDVSFAGRTDYGAYTVHRHATLGVKENGGAVRRLRVLGSMIEKGGEWKVFSYVVEG